MADNRQDNIKRLFKNTRSRVIIIFTLALLLLAIIVGFIKFLTSSAATQTISGAELTAPENIQSIPGSENPTAEYARLQEEQNLQQAKQANQKGGSAIPTIIRSQSFGNGVQGVGPQQGEGGLSFTGLNQQEAAGDQKGLWLQSLKDTNCSQDAMQKALNEGATLADIAPACSCVQLKDNNYKLSELQSICSCKDLKAAGFNTRQMKDAGFTTRRLRACGFDACELRAAGFTAQEMKDGGYADGELKGAGFSEDEIKQASGLPEGISAGDIRKASCNVEELAKLRAVGVSASAIRHTSGCDAATLKAAGYSAQDLKNAGFSAADLKNAGFSPADLKNAGFSARDLLDAGYTPEQLAAAGYTPDEIRAGLATLPPGISPDNLRDTGCDPAAIKRERLAGVSSKAIRQYAGCDANALKAGGFTDSELANTGFTPEQIKAASAIPSNQATMDDMIKNAGCDPERLRALHAEGVSAARIHELTGCSLAALKQAGYDAKALSDAGFTPAELLAAGFKPSDLIQAGLSPAAVIATGRKADCSVDSLKAARALGVDAATIKQTLGCSAAAMKAAGYTAAELRNAGFTAAELKNAGFTTAELKNAGFSAKELRDAGFSAQQLKNAGFNASELKDAGFSAADLKNAGFSAKELKDAGYSTAELKAAGFSADQLKQAGFSGSDLVNAGFSPSEAGTIAGLPILNQGPGPTSSVTALPSLAGQSMSAQQAAEQQNTKQLQAILNRQKDQMADQRYQQQLQQRIGQMQSVANQYIQEWNTVSTQTYVEGDEEDKSIIAAAATTDNLQSVQAGSIGSVQGTPAGPSGPVSIIRTGDVMYAVLDTSINSDEPGPILATIVSGKLKGAKLIGSFNLPGNADKMVISFNTMSVPGAAKTTSINAYAIDPNTARTALATTANHHYLMRYGSLFAATFLEGFGNAFQSANTTITIGGTGGVQQTTIQNGVGRSLLENAVIGLATLGKSWGQVAQQQFNRPTTVEVSSGTGFGILFTQDVMSL